MKHIHILALIFTGWLCGGCDSELYFLSEPYSYVDDVEVVRKAPTRIITKGEDYNAGSMLVEENLCLLYTYRHPNFFYAIFDMESGEELGEFCRRGNGPMESTNIFPASEIYHKDGHILADLLDVAKERRMTWDITASLETGQTVYENIIPWKWRRMSGTLTTSLFRKSDSELITISITEPFEDIRKIATPRFMMRSSEDFSPIREYTVFRDTLAKYDDLGNWGPSSPFDGIYAMNPSRTRLAMAMLSYPQINILDIDTGELKCFRIEGSPKATTSKIIIYYSSICCDSKRIYALYRNTDEELAFFSNGKEGLNPCQIHIFGWDGKLIERWQLDEFCHNICICGDKLYTIRYDTGIITEYDI